MPRIRDRMQREANGIRARIARTSLKPRPASGATILRGMLLRRLAKLDRLLDKREVH